MEFFFEVMIVSGAGELHEVRIDPRTAAVLAAEHATDDDEASELVMFREALRNSELALAELITSASGVISGKAVAATLEFEDGSPEADVLFVNGRCLIEVGVEARAGHVMEIELETGADDRHEGHERERDD